MAAWQPIPWSTRHPDQGRPEAVPDRDPSQAEVTSSRRRSPGVVPVPPWLPVGLMSFCVAEGDTVGGVVDVVVVVVVVGGAGCCVVPHAVSVPRMRMASAAIR